MELTLLLQQALREIAVSRPGNADSARQFLDIAVENVRNSETLLESRCNGNSEMKEFVGRDRDSLYQHSFLLIGVRPETAADLVSALIAEN